MSALATASETVARTRTGDYPIGFRQVGGAAGHREAPALARWARGEGFAGIDLKHDADEQAAAVRAAALAVPAADLPDWRGLISDDADRRAAAIERNRAYIPGHGVVDWGAVCRRLHQRGYRGAISIELEDDRFADSDEAVATGLLAARDHLRSV